MDGNTIQYSSIVLGNGAKEKSLKDGIINFHEVNGVKITEAKIFYCSMMEPFCCISNAEQILNSQSAILGFRYENRKYIFYTCSEIESI